MAGLEETIRINRGIGKTQSLCLAGCFHFRLELFQQIVDQHRLKQFASHKTVYLHSLVNGSDPADINSHYAVSVGKFILARTCLPLQVPPNELKALTILAVCPTVSGIGINPR